LHWTPKIWDTPGANVGLNFTLIYGIVNGVFVTPSAAAGGAADGYTPAGRGNYMAKRKRRQPAKAQAVGLRDTRPRCGLCGKTTRLTKTDCCGQWICDDEDQYVLFSYARNSCHRNHSRYTLCGHHYTEGHPGKWQECPTCRESFETEMYVYFGTNEYNFEKLANPPAYKPTKCARCKKVIRLGEDGYTITGTEYLCEVCSNREFAEMFKGRSL
jgi:hypothetical protein